jgi:hypothetical protein
MRRRSPELFATVGVETTIVTDMTGWSPVSIRAEALLMTEEGLELPGLSNLIDALAQQPCMVRTAR